MGILQFTQSKFEEFASKLDSENLDLLEIGDQDLYHGHNYGKKFRHVSAVKFKTWTPVDLNLSEGVVSIDLAEISDLGKQYDVITNFGTSEHVEYEEGQYNCWKNIHNWCKVGGYMIHEIPEWGSWKDHCRFYYDVPFFHTLAEKNGYEIIEEHRPVHPGQGHNDFFILKKTEDVEFFSFEEFMKIIIIDKSVSLASINIANNPKGLK